MSVIRSKRSPHIRCSAFIAAQIGTRTSVGTVVVSMLALTAWISTGAMAQKSAGRVGVSDSPTYKFEDLGELASVAEDVMVSLDRDGAVAYWTKAIAGTNSTLHATVWHHGEVSTMEEPPGYPNSIAHAINRQGDIAGWMNTSGNLVDSLSTTHGFIRRGNHTQIVPTLGGRDSRVYGLNDEGVAVGAASLASGARHAFATSRDGITDLGALPSGSSSTAYAVNSAGLIVGSSNIDGKASHAVSWRNNKIADLGTLPEGIASTAVAVNDLGEIVGYADTPDGVHAFLYTHGAMRDLGTLGNDPSEASGIDNHGEVVGSSNVTGTRRHAFLWRNGQMQDLNDLLPKGSGWTLLNAFSINDRGQIVCSARRNGESLHLLFLMPQSPSER